jgi:hypothetical protein
MLEIKDAPVLMSRRRPDLHATWMNDEWQADLDRRAPRHILTKGPSCFKDLPHLYT